MNAKKIAFGTKPTNKLAPVDTWVESRASDGGGGGGGSEAMKRLTIDIPESLHRAIKSQCAMRGTKIADEVRELLLNKYGNQ